jgi:hypothetical protein
MSGLIWIEPLPDEAARYKFRHLLAYHGLGHQRFAKVNGHLRPMILWGLEALSLTPRLSMLHPRLRTKLNIVIPTCARQRKKISGTEAIKAPIGADSRAKLMHLIEATSAKP